MMGQVADYKVLNKSCTSEKIENTKLKNLQRQKKLCLILDLDHTLVHTIYLDKGDNSIEEEEGYELIKFRPFVRKFLKEASKLFEMYIYTLGTRDFAMEIANQLDPESVYFGSRIIASEDSTDKYGKSLDVVPDVDESFVLIMDDMESVWSRYSRNLILMKKYVFFGPGMSPYKVDVFSDETEGSGALSNALKVLKEVHSLYFQRDNLSGDCDVRDLLEIVLKNSSKDFMT